MFILDGAIGTELKERGCSLDPILWSAGILATNPETVYQLHLDYLKNGADIITTNTYQISFESFATQWNFSKQETIEKICNKALELAFKARKEFPNKLVALSMSTFGANIYINNVGGQEFKGDYVDGSIDDIEQKMFSFHDEKLEIFLNYCQQQNEYPNFILFETVPVLLEAKVIAQILQQPKYSLVMEKHNIAAIISFSCKNQTQTNHGEDITECAKFIATQYPHVQGMSINCTTPQYILSLLQHSRPHLHSKQQLWCYPNSGECWNNQQQSWEQSSASKDFENCIQSVITIHGLCDVVGGCCRTSMSTISAIYRLIHQS